MKSPEEGGDGQQQGVDVEAAEDPDPLSWGQRCKKVERRYGDTRCRLDKMEQDISNLKTELGQAWDARKEEELKKLIGDRSMLQEQLVHLAREKAYLQEERNLMLKRETTATGTVHEDIARCHPTCAWYAYKGTTQYTMLTSSSPCSFQNSNRL
jgi:hypothetical protein